MEITLLAVATVLSLMIVLNYVQQYKTQKALKAFKLKQEENRKGIRIYTLRTRGR